MLTGDCRELHSKGPRDLFYVPGTANVKVSRRMRWMGHVAGNSAVKDMTKRDRLEDVGRDGG
jgi:hypothetical protein